MAFPGASPRDPYVLVLGDPALPERAPKLTSQVFSGAAVILRSRHNTATESISRERPELAETNDVDECPGK